MNFKWLNLLSGLLCGAMLAVWSFVLAFLAMRGAAGMVAALAPVVAPFVMLLVALIVALRAPTAAKAWRWLLITGAVMTLMWPLAAIYSTGSDVAGVLGRDQPGAGAVATALALGGGMIAWLAGFVGLFLGVVQLVVGLLVGRNPQIVIVQQAWPTQPANTPH